MADIDGHCDERFEPVRTALRDSLQAGTDVGASVAVFVDGQPVVDLWGGSLDEAGTAPWQRDSIANVWSTTKTMTFVCALMLADRGQLAFDAPVRRYWPELAAGGKEAVEVRHLLGHTAGLSGWSEPLAPEDLADWERCCDALAAQQPWWEPGTASGYHALTQGYLVGEVVRRITGTTIGEWFAAEVAKPLGADFHIGLSAGDDRRVAPMIPAPEPGLQGLGAGELAVRTFANPPIGGATANEEWWRRAQIPAANGHGNARSVALVQHLVANGGEVGGVRLLSEQALEPVFWEQANGTDLVLGLPLRFGMGYGLGNELLPLGPRACFWGGYGGSIVLSDQDTRLTVAYVMNRMADALVGDLRGLNVVLAATGVAGS